MPRRRKGIEYSPEIPLLLRDAQPKYAEISGERDLRKRRERERARDLATDRLLKMYWDAKKSGQMDQLDPSIRIFCEQLKQRNRGGLPKAKGGRPADEHHRLLIAIKVQEAIEGHGKRRGSVEKALREVSESLGVSYDHVRDIHYDPDPEWRRTVFAELARRKSEDEAG